MFHGVGRRLAILNALMVIAIIALVGIVTWVTLSRQLDNEINSALRERIATWQRNPLVESTAATPTQQEHDGEEDDEHEHERDVAIVGSGDTLLFVVDARGQLIVNPRDVSLKNLPVGDAIDNALDGHEDTRTVALDEGGNVRVLTVPLMEHEQVVGAAQALRSLREHEQELALVRWMTLLGAGLGALIAIPAGLYLSRRAMRPINAAFTRQRAFVADASHELRTPLTLVRANAELILLDPEQRVNDARPELESILAEVNRTDRLVDDLLLLARTDAGQLAFKRTPQRLDQIARSATVRAQTLFDAAEITLITSDLAAAGVSVDEERIEQVVGILLSNALQHTPPGGTVEIITATDASRAVLQVRDTGAGIPTQHLSRVFDRFYRVDSARSRGAGGTGLGLAIAKAIIEAHDGRITVESTAGSGTTFTISLSTA